MSAPIPKASAPAKSWTFITFGMVTTTILTTYALWIHHGGRVFLPTISNTWEAPPGNYYSRFFFGFACDMMYVCCLFIYWTRKWATDQGRVQTFSDETLLMLSLVAVFSISWVPAICDSPDPDCRGNNLIHSTFAVFFFIGYTMFMVIEAKESKLQLSMKNSWIRVSLILVSLVSKIRWIPGLFGNDTPIAIVEWTDVGSIVLWTVHFIILHSEKLRWTIVKWDETNSYTDNDTPIGTHISVRFIRKCAINITLLTLASTLIAGLINGSLPKGKIPMISDMWVYPPGDWFSRWGVMRGVSCALTSNTILYFATAPQNPNLAGTWSSALTDVNGPAPDDARSKLLTLSWIAFLAMAVVGCVDEKANHTVHITCAIIFFGTYDLYMILATIWSYTRENLKINCSKSYLWVLIIISLVCKMRFLNGSVAESTNWDDIVAIMEWTNTFVILAFMHVDIFSRDCTKDFYVMVTSSSTSGRHAPDAKQNYAQLNTHYEGRL